MPEVGSAVAFLSAGATLGARAAYGVLPVPLADALGGGRSLAAGIISFQLVVGMVSAPLLGGLLDRWGPRGVFAGAAVLASLGMILATVAQTS